jgi:hypothetical protein
MMDIPTFDQWYARYPRKQGKAEARKRWAKMSPPERLSAWNVLDGWTSYAAAAGTKFIPYASTWLNQGRWEDEPPVVEVERKAAPGMDRIRQRRSLLKELES